MLESLPGTVCHMHDVLIWGLTQAEHNLWLTEVCKNCGTVLNPKKCVFSPTSILFLGHIIDGERVQKDHDKITDGKLSTANN